MKSSKKLKTIDAQLSELDNEIFFYKKCVTSNQRPRICFNEDGICRACLWAEEKENIYAFGEQIRWYSYYKKWFHKFLKYLNIMKESFLGFLDGFFEFIFGKNTVMSGV